jgi:hypothetical protein
MQTHRRARVAWRLRSAWGRAVVFPQDPIRLKGYTFPRRNLCRRETLFPRGSRDFPILCNGLPGHRKLTAHVEIRLLITKECFLRRKYPRLSRFPSTPQEILQGTCAEKLDARNQSASVVRYRTRRIRKGGLYGSGGNMYSVTYGR